MRCKRLGVTYDPHRGPILLARVVLVAIKGRKLVRKARKYGGKENRLKSVVR